MQPPADTCSSFLLLRVACGLCFTASGLQGADWPQWRGPNRNGIAQESGLLKEWPKEGPKLLWKQTNVGSGYATPAVVGDRFFLLANEGLDNEFVAALAVQDGAKIWSTRLGLVGNPKQRQNFPGARSTPTVDGDFLYALSSDGDLRPQLAAFRRRQVAQRSHVPFLDNQGVPRRDGEAVEEGDEGACGGQNALWRQRLAFLDGPGGPNPDSSGRFALPPHSKTAGGLWTSLDLRPSPFGLYHGGFPAVHRY
jgi:hypothetical protein